MVMSEEKRRNLMPHKCDEGKSRTMKLVDWARQEFDEPIPSMPTLLKYAKNGMISPPPAKAGRCWRVDRTARFIGMSVFPVIKQNDDERLKRILKDGSPT